jgi:hypothetical protein
VQEADVAESFDEIRQEMQEQFDRSGYVDLEWWLQSYPHYEAEIEEFVSYFLDHADVGEFTPTEQRVFKRAAEKAVTAQLGGWARQAAEVELGRRISELQGVRAAEPAGAERERKRAVVTAWVVKQLASVETEIGRLKLQKVLYLLEAAIRPGLFTSFRAFAYGPFDPELKYGDAEKIGEQEDWIEVDGSLIRPGASAGNVDSVITETLEHVDVAEDFVAHLARHSGWDLGVWATVLSLAQRILVRGEPVNAEAVLGEMLTIPAWREKARLREFAPERVVDALHQLRVLGLLSGEDLAS